MKQGSAMRLEEATTEPEDGTSGDLAAATFVARALARGFSASDFEQLTEALDQLAPRELVHTVERAARAAASRRSAGPVEPAPTLAALADPRLMLPHVAARSWKRFVETVVTRMCEARSDLVPADAQRAFTRPPKMSGWLIGGGVAIPHWSLPGLERAVVAVATTRTRLEVSGPDGEPVRLAFFLLEPVGKPEIHLKLLARIAGLCAASSNLGLLYAAQAPDALYNSLQVLDAMGPGP